MGNMLFFRWLLTIAIGALPAPPGQAGHRDDAGGGTAQQPVPVPGADAKSKKAAGNIGLGGVKDGPIPVGAAARTPGASLPAGGAGESRGQSGPGDGGTSAGGPGTRALGGETKKIFDEINKGKLEKWQDWLKGLGQPPKPGLDQADLERVLDAYRKDWEPALRRRLEQERDAGKGNAPNGPPVMPEPQPSPNPGPRGGEKEGSRPKPGAGGQGGNSIDGLVDSVFGDKALAIRENIIAILVGTHAVALLAGAGLLKAGALLLARGPAAGVEGGRAGRGPVDKPSRKSHRLGPPLSRKVAINSFPSSSPEVRQRSAAICAAWGSQPPGSRWDPGQADVARDFIVLISGGPDDGTAGDRALFVLRYWAKYVCQFEPEGGDWAWSVKTINSVLPDGLEVRPSLPLLGASFADNRTLLDELEGDGPVLVRVLRPFLRLVDKATEETVSEYPGCGVMGSPNEVGRA